MCRAVWKSERDGRKKTICSGSTSDKHSHQWRDDSSRNSIIGVCDAQVAAANRGIDARVGKPVVRGVDRLLTLSASDYEERAEWSSRGLTRELETGCTVDVRPQRERRTCSIVHVVMEVYWGVFLVYVISFLFFWHQWYRVGRAGNAGGVYER